MSDVKRVSLTTISNSISSFGANEASTSAALMSSASAAALRFGSDFALGQSKPANLPGSGAEKKAANNKTIRLNVELFATDTKKYPEFNFSKLLHLEKKKQKKLKQKSNGFSDPFEENDDDVARIAKQLEEKYGSTYGSGRGRSKRDDLCDIGLGYDESDSFIDNTEAYDEVVPEEVETLEGGFYINCGALEFKKLRTSTTTKTDEIIKMPNRPKKRVLSSSSEDSSSSDEDDEDDDDDDDDDNSDDEDSEDGAEVETDGKASVSSGQTEKRAKTATKKKVEPTKLKEKSRESDKNSAPKKKPIGLSFSSSNSPKPNIESVGSDSDKERVRQKTIKTTTVKDMLKAKRDSFLKMQEGGDVKSSNAKNINGELKGKTSKSSDDDSSDDDSDRSDNNSDSNQSAQPVGNNARKSDDNSEKLRSSDTKLPELDADVFANIQEFKDLVKSKNLSGKKFLFDEHLTELFLKIDEACMCIEKPQRNMVFAHLEYYLSLPKYYFLRKAKQLRIKEEKLKSKRALAKLRKVIVEAMPSAIANYELELRKFADMQSGNVNSDNPPKMPKKRFPWNENTRNLLYDVYQVRWTSYPVLGTRKETLEDFISSYMKGKVVQLWPSGWMRYEDLQREIEKRKIASKKLKEKKKETIVAGNEQSPNAAATVTAPTPLLFMKQLEEFSSGGGGGGDTRSRTNSDTDSVASSATSGGQKRKNSEHTKQNKTKSQKTSSEPEKNSSYQNSKNTSIGESDRHSNHQSGSEINKKATNKSPTIIVDFSSPSKRTDHSIHNIISSTSPTALNQMPQQQQLQQQPQTQLQQHHQQQQQQNQLSQLQQKHSNSTICAPPAAHVINLDNYKSASDILMTSQQMLSNNGTTVQIKSERNSNTATIIDTLRRESSSESDGVEIVGIYPAKPPTAISKSKLKKNAANNQSSRSATPTYSAGLQMDVASNVKMLMSQYGINTNTNNNNTITFGKSNKKSSMSGNNLKNSTENNSLVTEYDALNVAKVLRELEELQQQQQKHLKQQQQQHNKKTSTTVSTTSKEPPIQ